MVRYVAVSRFIVTEFRVPVNILDIIDLFEEHIMLKIKKKCIKINITGIDFLNRYGKFIKILGNEFYYQCNETKKRKKVCMKYNVETMLKKKITNRALVDSESSSRVVRSGITDKIKLEKAEYNFGNGILIKERDISKPDIMSSKFLELWESFLKQDDASQVATVTGFSYPDVINFFVSKLRHHVSGEVFLKATELSKYKKLLKVLEDSEHLVAKRV